MIKFITDLKKTPPFQGGDELSSDMSSSFRGNPTSRGGEDVIRKFSLFWLPVILWASIIFSFSANPTVKASEVHWQDVTVKKVAHIIFYGVLATLLYRALKSEKVGTKKAGYIAVVFASLYGITDEIHQSFTPGREPAVRDVIFDTIGAVLAIYLIWKLLPRTPRTLRNWAKRLEMV